MFSLKIRDTVPNLRDTVPKMMLILNTKFGSRGVMPIREETALLSINRLSVYSPILWDPEHVEDSDG